MNRSVSTTISALRVTVALGMIAGLLLSPRLWVGTRAYPPAPVWRFLPALGPPIDYAVMAALLVLLVWIAVGSRPAKPVAAFVVLAATYALFDQSRWQPWFYQYLFMLVALAIPDSPLDTCRIIVASVYFWSGAHKANSGFVQDTLPWMLGSLPEHLPAFARASIPILGWGAPLAEMGIAAALLTRRFRSAAVASALAMHAFILICIGVLHRYYDVIVWPWNLAMCAMVLLLFWRRKEIPRVGRSFFPKLVLVLFGVAPLLSFFNLWDGYLSFALYSGNNSAATIYMADAVADRLPDQMQAYVTVNDSLVDELDLFAWSFGELKVPPYAELRVFKTIGREVCAAAGNPSEMLLVVQPKETWFQRRRQRTYDCAALSPAASYGRPPGRP